MGAKSSIQWTDASWTPLRAKVRKDAREIAKQKGYTSLLPIIQPGRVGPHCERVSPGCVHCYSETNNGRCLPFNGTGLPFNRQARDLVEIFLDEKILLQPRHWKKPRKVFVCSQTDLFGEFVPDEMIDKVFDIMWECCQHTFQILTKRVERMCKYVEKRASRRSFGWTEKERVPMGPGYEAHLDDIFYRNQCGYAHGDWRCSHPKNNEEGECHNYCCPIAESIDDWESLKAIGVEREYEFDEKGLTEESTDWMRLCGRPKHALPPNVQFGFSAENQKTFNERMTRFESMRWIVGPYNVLFASLEPLIGPISFDVPYPENEHTWSALSRYDFSDGSGELKVPHLNLVIAGGESGPNARPSNLAWYRSLRDQCKAAGVKYFMKQLGAHPWTHINGGQIPLRIKDHKGGNPEEWPEDLRIREFPEVNR